MESKYLHKSFGIFNVQFQYQEQQIIQHDFNNSKSLQNVNLTGQIYDKVKLFTFDGKDIILIYE